MPERLVLILVKPWLQCLAILWGIGCSMSRITDNRHHWWDVLVGIIMGMIFSAFTTRVFCRDFRTNYTGEGIEVALTQMSNQNGTAFIYSTKRHQSVKKLLNTSNGGVESSSEGREIGDVPTTWTA